jgi:hypothetical protein
MRIMVTKVFISPPTFNPLALKGNVLITAL